MDNIKMEDIRQTKEWAKYLRGCGWVVEKVGGVNVFVKKIPPTPFSMIKVQRFKGDLNFNDLKRMQKKYNVVYSVVEPASSLGYDPKIRVGPSGWRVNKRPFLPTKTVAVDLKKSKKQLWSELSTNAKRILKKKDYTSEQIIFRKNDSSDEKSRIEFYKAWKKSSKIWVMSEARFNKLLNSFGKKASLWVSESMGELLSGIVLLESEDTANYFQTWTSKGGRKLGAHYHLVWQVILSSKKKRLRWFDFEGVLDERWPMKKWAGFSEFKKKFGGKIITYPGSFTKWF